MGANAKVKIHEEWYEPLIMWVMIAAGKGERKSPALDKRFKFTKWKIENPNKTNESSPCGAQIKTSNSPPALNRRAQYGRFTRCYDAE